MAYTFKGNRTRGIGPNVQNRAIPPQQRVVPVNRSDRGAPQDIIRRDSAGRTRVQAVNNPRAGYNALSEQFGPNVIITEGYLRSEVLLGAQSTINFDISANAGAPQNTEVRLSINDAFIVTHIAVMIGRVVDTAVGPHGAMTLHTFPNDKVFTTAAQQLAMQALYSGAMRVQVNDIVYIEALDMLSFLRADNAQQGVAVSTVATTGITGYSSMEGNRAFKPLTPFIMFNGPAKNSVTIELPESLAMAATAPAQHWGVLLCRGFLAQNGGGFRPSRR